MTQETASETKTDTVAAAEPGPIEREICALLKVSLVGNETRAEFLARVSHALTRLSDKKWDAMSADAQLWANAAAKATEKAEPVPEFAGPLPMPVEVNFGAIDILAFGDHASISLPWPYFLVLHGVLTGAIKDLDEDAVRDGEKNPLYDYVVELHKALDLVEKRWHANHPGQTN